MSGVRPESQVMSYGAIAKRYEPLLAEARWKTQRFGMDDFDVTTIKDQSTTVSPLGRALAVIGTVIRIEQCVGEFGATGDTEALGSAWKAAQRLHDLVVQKPIDNDPFVDTKFPRGKYPGYGR